MFCVFFVKKHASFKWKDIISGFPVSPGSAEALVRWGGKIKYVLIAYFIGNIFAKNCCSRTVYVKIIASQRWDVFWDTVYITVYLSCVVDWRSCRLSSLLICHTLQRWAELIFDKDGASPVGVQGHMICGSGSMACSSCCGGGVRYSCWKQVAA